MIEIKNLIKKFSNNTVIDNLNLEVCDGEITALVGKNGAGKSTLIRLICGLLKKDAGEILLSDNKKIGVLLGGDINLYSNLTAYEIILFFANLNGVRKKLVDKRIDELDEILNFKEFINNRANTFSRGMKQKVGLAITMIHDPDILLLDEPSTGLDVEASNDVIDFIKFLKAKSKTILIATHNIFEISDLSDSIAFLINGKIDQKVKTSSFFEGCSSAEKSGFLVHALKEETPNEK